MKLPKDLSDLLLTLPTTEDWRNNLGLTRTQYGRLRFYSIDPSTLVSSTLRAVHGCGATYEHPFGSLIVVVRDDFVMRYISGIDNASDFEYRLGCNGQEFVLQPRTLPRFYMQNDQYMMSSRFEDITAHYGDVCGIDIANTHIRYRKDNGLLRRSEWLPSFRCKPFYAEKDFRDMVFEKNLKGFRPSFANLF